MFYRMRVGLTLNVEESLMQVIQPPTLNLWVDREACERIFSLLGRAKHSIFIQMFIWREDEMGTRMAQTLVERADKGVTVQIIKETIGDAFELSTDFFSTKRHTDGIWKRFWSHPNIHVTHAVQHDHSKVYIIDHHILILTGMNIGDEYYYEWHDYMVELRGVSYVDQYLKFGDPEGTGKVRLLINTNDHRIMRKALTDLILSAKKSVVLEQAYISDPEIVSLLIERSLKGIDIMLIIPAEPDLYSNANMYSVSRLMNEGSRKHVRILLYPDMIHGKIVLADQKRAFIGSTNLMKSSLDDMGEVNVLLDNYPESVIGTLQTVLLKDTLRSRSLTDPPYFPMLRRLLAWLNL